MIRNFFDSLSNFVGTYLFTWQDGKRKWPNGFGLAGLYASGVILWSIFLEKGSLAFNFQDWYEITGPRLLFLKDAWMHGVLPLHISNFAALGRVTTRYMAIPDAFLAPQSILLLFLDIGKFILVNQVLMYSLGFIGLLWFRRKYSLSLFAFTILFALFNFNGHILAHYGVGHATWGGYFLFPWFAMLIVCLLEGDHSWSWVAKMSLLLLLIELNGSFHQFVWLLIFLGFLALASWKNALPAVKAMVFSMLVSLVRLLPPSLLVSAFSGNYHFYGGYPSATDLLDALVTPKPPSMDPFVYIPNGLMWWELSLYVGLVGACFLAFFGIYRWLQKRAGGAGNYELAFPLLGMLLLSIGDVYQVVQALHIPLFDGERVSSRMISVPFVFVLILAVIEFQRWLDLRRIHFPFVIACSALLTINLFDLWTNFTVWKVDMAAYQFTPHPLDLRGWYVANHADPAYTHILILGAAGTAAGLLLLGLLVWMEKRGVLDRFARRVLPKLEQPQVQQDGMPSSLGRQALRLAVKALAPQRSVPIHTEVDRTAVWPMP